MKFLSICKSAERNAPPSQEEMAKMGKLVEEGMKAGWLLATEGCLPTALGARVRNSSGKLTVTDGPFTEAKEVVGGFAILRAKSKEEAIQLAKDFCRWSARASASFGRSLKRTRACRRPRRLSLRPSRHVSALKRSFELSTLRPSLDVLMEAGRRERETVRKAQPPTRNDKEIQRCDL